MKREDAAKVFYSLIEKLLTDLAEIFYLLNNEEVDDSGELKRLVLVKQKVISVTNGVLLLYSEHIKLKFENIIEQKIFINKMNLKVENNDDVIDLIKNI